MTCSISNCTNEVITVIPEVSPLCNDHLLQREVLCPNDENGMYRTIEDTKPDEKGIRQQKWICKKCDYTFTQVLQEKKS